MAGKKGPEIQETRDRLIISDSSWINLGQLRALVAEADQNGWSDECLVSQGRANSGHPTLRGWDVTGALLVEGPT